MGWVLKIERGILKDEGGSVVEEDLGLGKEASWLRRAAAASPRSGVLGWGVNLLGLAAGEAAGFVEELEELAAVAVGIAALGGLGEIADGGPL